MFSLQSQSKKSNGQQFRSTVCKSWRSAIQEFPNPKQSFGSCFVAIHFVNTSPFSTCTPVPSTSWSFLNRCEESSAGARDPPMTAGLWIELKLPKFGSEIRPYWWKTVDAVLSHYINRFEVFSLDGSQHVVAAIFDGYALAFGKAGVQNSFDENAGHEIILKLIPNSTPIRGPVHSAALSQVSIDFCNISSFVNFNENLKGVEKNCIHFLEDFEFSNPTTGIPILSCACGVFERDNERIYGLPFSYPASRTLYSGMVSTFYPTESLATAFDFSLVYIISVEI
ncbi:hypothetical protein SLEP1_g33838 [Rubroshorea leprosula]|uniref:Uncharacterized protein n=1 Tax=Rubroshorea leprosula TaxID=152421 RepID=A0AAV5KI00_9ROSI|nr:hypothetical protein SLEP1_g33838 [Rubroshorea leprosula]